MLLNTESFVEHDRCPRFRQWNARYAPFRVSFHFALHDALTAAIHANDPSLASERVTSLAASPGIDFIGPTLYQAVAHHANLAEILAAYTLSVPSAPLDPIPMKGGAFQPLSTLLPDGRLRRIVLTDRWSAEREQMERFSWRTVADAAITNRPMNLTVILIGSLREGFRVSPWTQGFVHPANGGIRIKRREGGQFAESWKKVYREHSGLTALEWLKVMQQDGVFEGLVHSVTVDVPPDRDEILGQIAEMAREMASSAPARQTRSACYRFTPCPFLPACSSTRSPAESGWAERPISQPLTVLD